MSYNINNISILSSISPAPQDLHPCFLATMQATMQVEPMFLEEIQHETGRLWHPLVRALRLLWPGGWIFWMLERWSKFANKAQEYSQHLTAMSQVQITSRWSAHPDHHRSPDPWPYRTNPYVWREWSRGWMCWQEIFIGFFLCEQFFPVADRRFIQPVWTSNTSQMRGQSWHWGRPF